MKSDAVHVTLDDYNLVRNGFLGDVESVKMLPLNIDRRLLGIDVLGGFRVLIHRTSAESDNVSDVVENREHEPVPEPVDKISLVGFADKSRFYQKIVLHASGFEMLVKRVPGVGRIAEAELRCGIGGNPAGFKVFLRLPACLQLLEVELGGLFVEGTDVVPESGGLFVALDAAGVFDSSSVGKIVESVNIRKFLGELDEPDSVPTDAASEALENALGLADE